MKIRVGHLYPEYLNIYADRGGTSPCSPAGRRCGARARDRAHRAGRACPTRDARHLYIGGGQDREQALIAPDLAAKGSDLSDAVAGGTALLAVCGGYQLLGRGYRGRDGSLMPGAGLFGHETVAGSTRMIGDVLLDCELEPGAAMPLAGFENHAGRTVLDADASALGRVVHGFGNDGESGLEGCRVGRAIGTYLHGPLLPRNPWLADWRWRRPSDMRSRATAAARAASRRARGGGVPGGCGSCPHERRTPLEATFLRAPHPTTHCDRIAEILADG